MTNKKAYKEIAHIFELMNDPREKALEEVIKIAQKHNCPLVRHEAVFALGEMATPTVIPTLKKITEKDNNYVVKHEALMAIGTLAANKEVTFLKKFLDDKQYEIATSAQIAIERITEKENTEQTTDKYIEQLSKKNSRNKRIHALFKLMNKALNDETIIKEIGKVLLNDPCSIVRHEAGFVLGEIGTKQCIKLMNKALEKETTPIVIHETLFALGTTGKKEALPTIEKYLEDEDYIIRESAKIAKDRILHLKNPYSGARHYAKKE